jgi:hypothetical protein
VKTVLEKCPDELKFLDQFSGGGLIEKLQTLLTSTCARVTHEEAITILRKAMENGKEFKFEPVYGGDTAKEHEKYLTEEYFHSPDCPIEGCGPNADLKEIEKTVRVYAGLKTLLIESCTHRPMPEFRAVLNETILKN